MTAAAASPGYHDYYRPRSTQLITDELPEHAALEKLFSRQLAAEHHHKLLPLNTSLSRRHHLAAAHDDEEEVEWRVDRQMAQLDKHRLTVHTLTNRIIELHSKMKELQRENGELRHQLDSQLYETASHTDTTRHDPAVLPTSRYAMLVSKVERQASQLKHYKQKVISLQQKLIQRNEEQKKQLMCHGAQCHLATTTQHCASLRQVHDKQQQVISKLQQLVHSKHKGASYDEKANEVLRQENQILRMQLDNILAEHRTITPSHAVVVVGDYDDDDNNNNNNNKLQRTMLPKLYDDEKLTLQLARQRIKSLEQQLEDNAREWSRARTDLKLQLEQVDRPTSQLSHRRRTLPMVN